MRFITSILLSLVFVFSFGVNNVNATSVFEDNNSRSYLCDEEGECGLDIGIQLLYDRIRGVENDRTFSEYIQDVVAYLLTFLTLIAVLYIIYAGFNLLLGNGEEEKLKHTKKIIIYVIIGIVIIWLAYPIVSWLFSILG